ncbi:hypothetical protein LJR016_002258 [Devosia sp. LjRoot16]|uniref:hypothetical protein n=1 Tax=Devosia sp. LjRoot16 TaxID=3342271 RepID=UPI003ECF00B5
MKLFATKVWGTSLDQGVPIATFGSNGHVNRLLKLASHGDRLIFVGTKTSRTRPELQGRILSMAEFGFQPLRSLDYFKREDLDPRDFDEKGNFKFPFGVPIVRGWMFEPQPRVNEAIRQKLTMLSTPGAEEITGADDIAAILSLPHHEVVLPPIPQLAKMLAINNLLKPTTGPAPSDATYEVTKTAQETSWTYAMRYGNTNIWKVGHATSVKGREDEINKHIPFEIGIAMWKAELQQKWPDAVTAYAMEQKVFDILKPWRTTGERINCTLAELGTAWQQAIMGD